MHVWHQPPGRCLRAQNGVKPPGLFVILFRSSSSCHFFRLLGIRTVNAIGRDYFRAALPDHGPHRTIL